MTTTETYVLDRITENLAHLEHLETGKQAIIPQHWLPNETAQGHALQITHNPETNTVTLTVDDALTNELRENNEQRRASIPKGPNGDISL